MDVRKIDINLNGVLFENGTQESENQKSAANIHIHPSQIKPTKTTKVDASHKIKKSKKKGLFISYALDAPYEEKKFVLELAKQLSEIGMHDDVWFDKDVLQNDIKSPFAVSSRLEVAEKCRGAVIILSESFFLSSQTRNEADMFVTRATQDYQSEDGNPRPDLLIVKLSGWENGLEKGFESLIENISVNLSTGKISRLSEAEKVSMFISVLNKQLEKISSGFALRVPRTIEDVPTKIQFKTKPLVNWGVKDVQDWLMSLKIHEKYIISFEEFEIDGYLLQSLTDSVLSNVLAVDSQICRRKILQRIKTIVDEETRTSRFDEWSKYKTVRPKPNQVYVIQDPDDGELGNILKQDLESKGMKVLSHSRLGQSKDEFLRSNANGIASSSYVILLLTSKGCASPFVFYEAAFVTWLARPFIVAVFEKCFDSMRLALSAMLSEVPAINFATALYVDALDLLTNEIKPTRAVSGVVFEQRYLKHVAEGVCLFREMADRIGDIKGSSLSSVSSVASITKIDLQLQQPKLFISYQWDHQSKVRALLNNLKSGNFACWSDMNHVTRRPVTQSMPRMTPASTSRMSLQDNLTNEIERNMEDSNVIVLCVTPRYLQSADSLTEVSMAAYYKKPIVAVLLQWLAWPPDTVPYGLRRIFATVKCFDLSNEKLFAKNLPSVIAYISRLSSR